MTEEYTINALIKLTTRGTQAGPTLLMMDAIPDPTLQNNNLLILKPSELPNEDKVRVAMLQSSGNMEFFDFNHVLPLNQWLLFTILRTVDGTLSLYVNATHIESISNPDPLRTDVLEKFYLGADMDAELTDFFGGSMDEIRIYNRTLSDSEIQQEFDTLFQESVTTTTTTSPTVPITTPPPGVDMMVIVLYLSIGGGAVIIMVLVIFLKRRPVGGGSPDVPSDYSW